MSQKLIESVGRSARLKVLNELKRTQGLSVPDLAERLGLSYMGIKDVCVDLEKRGLVDARRQPKPEGTTGRPKLIYSLTERARELFPTASNPLTLEILETAKRLFGPTAAEKLLMLTWQRRAEVYTERAKRFSLKDRVQAFAKIREAEGTMAEWSEEGETFVMIEHHSPVLDVLRAFPMVARLETELFQKVLGASVERFEEQTGGQLRITFRIQKANTKFPVGQLPLPMGE